MTADGAGVRLGPLLLAIPLQALGVKAETTAGKADSTALSRSAIASPLFFPRFASSQTQ
ncbi:hypothetical protein AGROH133_05823 [Agrobacterium tumefaciens]|nr:hypothetical protein AGROH133_05823 [Agrobacterium tumefaciens]